MKKKFICTVCGYIYEGTEAPEQCPICKAPASKFKELEEDEAPVFATAHILGAARKEGANEEMIKDLNAHFSGECGEVGMYFGHVPVRLIVKGYPENSRGIQALCFLRKQSMPANLPNSSVMFLKDTKSNLEARIAAEKGALVRDKFRIAKNAKGPPAWMPLMITVHENGKKMRARHAAGFLWGLYKRYFK
jgi:rubredoxin